MNYVLLQNNFPPVIVKSLDKKNYIGALNSADAGDLEAFFEYISKQLIWSLELSIKAAKGESIEEPDDLDKQIELLNRKLVSKDEIKKKKSREVIQETFTNSLEPLLIIIEERLSKFDHFFFEKEHFYIINNPIQTTTMLQNIGRDLDYLRMQIFFDKNNPGKYGH